MEGKPLRDTCVAVNVWTDENVNSSEAIKKRLEALGAKVFTKLTDKVTHLVFRNESKKGAQLFEKAAHKGIHVVSPSWVDACVRAGGISTETEHQAARPVGVDQPFSPHNRKRPRSLEPKHELTLDPSDPTFSSSQLLREEGEKGDKRKSKSPRSNRRRRLSPTKKMPKIEEETNQVEDEGDRFAEDVLHVDSKDGGGTDFDFPEDDDAKEQETIQVKPHSTKRSPKPRAKDAKVPCTSIPAEGSHKETKEAENARKGKKRGVIKGIMSATSMDTAAVFAICKFMGGFRLVHEVTHSLPRITHLIAEEPKRTLKMLYAIAQGAWILKPSFVYQSLEAGEWLDPESFECTSVPGAPRSRLAQGGGRLLEGKRVHVVGHTKPSVQDMVELIKLCGGKWSNSLHHCDVCIAGEGWSPPDSAVSPIVREEWLLNSIFHWKLAHLDDYLVATDDEMSQEI